MKNKNIFIFLIVIIAIIASFLRFINLADYMTFLGDQGRDALIIKRIITLEHLPLIGPASSVGEIYLGPFYYYMMSPFLLFANFNPIGLGFGVAIMSILGLIISTILIKNEFDKKTSILFFILSTFSFSLVTLARFSWNPNLLPFFSFFTIYFLYLWIKNKRVVFAFIFGSMFAFSIQLHYLALFLIPALFIYFLIKIKTFKNIKTTLTQIFSAIFGFIIFTTPLIAFDLRHDFLNFKGFGKLISGSGESYTGFSYWQKIVDTVVNLMNHALFMPLGNGVIFVIIFSLIILTSFFVYKKTKSDFLLINILCVLIYILSFAFIDSARHLHYFTPIYLSFYFLIATVPKIYKSKYVSYSIFSLFLIVFIILNIQGYSYIFYEKNELNQVEHAQKIADSFQNKITGEPIQIVTIPFTESHGQYRYFLDQKKHDLLSQDSGEQAQELFVMCFEECNPDGDAQWQIASFENKKIADEWDVENVKIYKIVHSK